MKLLLLNPNSSQAMTSAMELAAKATPISDAIEIDTYTAPCDAPVSIDSHTDLKASTEQVRADHGKIDWAKYDAVLVACFSVHPLVAKLAARAPRAVVTGIFEASVWTAMALTAPIGGSETWGIVTTGKWWEAHLADGVEDLVHVTGHLRGFCGVFSTGLTASDLHSLKPEEISAKVKQATLNLMKTGNVGCVVMGCGAMAGLEEVIRDAARETYGRKRGDRLYVIDGVKAGVLQLHQMVNSRKIFR